MKQGILSDILDYSNRANPYPLYAELRKTPVFHDGDGPYVISTYHDIQSLLHDPRLSSEARNLAATAGIRWPRARRRGPRPCLRAS